MPLAPTGWTSPPPALRSREGWHASASPPHAIRPNSLTEACALVAAKDLRILAGATDLLSDPFGSSGRDLLDISRLPELQGIELWPGEIRIGAAVTWSQLRDADLPPFMATLQAAAATVGGVQIQNRGTIGGNVCNASAAADGLPPLLALDADVELASNRGCRRLSLQAFLGDGSGTARRSDEILTGIVVQSHPRSWSQFIKLGRRSDVVIAVVSVSIVAERIASDRIDGIRICVGAASRTPVRLHRLEDRLSGLVVEQWPRPVAQGSDLDALTPIDDGRATAAYRRHAAAVLIDRMLRPLVEKDCV